MSDNNDVPRGPQPEVKSQPNVALIAGLVIVAASVVFFLLNGDHLEVNFLGFHHTTTIRWALLMTIVLGALLDRVFTIWWRRRKAKKNDD